MKPLGKAVKIGKMQNLPEQETLTGFIISYRDTPHVSTEAPPAHILFRDRYRNDLLHHKTPDDKIREARQTDSDIKKEHKTVDINYKFGDQVFLRNYKKKSKFDPYYLPEKLIITEVLAEGYISLEESLNTDKCLMRHPNDVKIFEGDIPDHNAVPDNSENNIDWKRAFKFISNNDHVHYDEAK